MLRRENERGAVEALPDAYRLVVILRYSQGLSLEEVAEMVVRDRRNLSYDGVVMPIVALNPTSGAIEAEPELVTHGFIDGEEDQLLAELRVVIDTTIKESGHDERTDEAVMKDKIRLSLKRHIQKATGRRPVIIPVIMEI